MPKGRCTVPECGREAYCRNLCRPHYEASRNWAPRDRTIPAVCSKCGTEYRMQYRALTGKCPPCAKADAVEKQRTPEYRRAASEMRRTIYPRCKIMVITCAECGRLWSGPSSPRIYCSDHCSHEAAMKALGCRDRTCRDCGVPLGYISLNILCAPCSRANRLESNRRAKAAGRQRGDAWATMKTARKRAQRYGVDYEPFNRTDVFDRDGWRCGICAR